METVTYHPMKRPSPEDICDYIFATSWEVCHKVGGRCLAGFEVGEVTLLFRVKLAVILLQSLQQFGVLLLWFVAVC